MAGEAPTQMIFFIGAVIIATGVIGVLSVNAHSITAAYSMNSKTLASQLQTDITIINDPAAIPYVQVSSNYNYSFYVKNTGKNTLNPTAANMFIDGNYVNTTNRFQFDRCTIMDTSTSCTSSSSWYPTQVLRLNYTTAIPFSTGDHTVRVIAENGVADTLPFRI